MRRWRVERVRLPMGRGDFCRFGRGGMGVGAASRPRFSGRLRVAHCGRSAMAFHSDCQLRVSSSGDATFGSGSRVVENASTTYIP